MPEAITESCRQEAQAETQRVLEAAKRQAEAIRQRAVSQSGIESRNTKLQVRRQAIDSAFGRKSQPSRRGPWPWKPPQDAWQRC